MPIPCLTQRLFNDAVPSEGVINVNSELCASNGLLDNEDEGTSIFRNVGKYLPAETA